MKISFFYPQPHLVACRILVPRPGIEPKRPQWKLPSPDPWTTGEFPLRILSSHFLGHLPNPWLETIQACRAAGKTAFLSFFQNFHLNAFGFTAGRRVPVDFQQRFCDSWEGGYYTNPLGVQWGIMPESLCGRDGHPVITARGLNSFLRWWFPRQPQACSLCRQPVLSAADPPRRGMWWDCIPRHNPPAPPRCQRPPRRCVSHQH